MTYKELMNKAEQHFDPDGKGIIYGYPVRVLLNISLTAEEQGWDQQVKVELIKDCLTSNKALDERCVAEVLALL